MNRMDDRLSYLHAVDNDYTVDQENNFNPCKNLNNVFQSIPIEDVDVETLKVYLRVRPNLPEETCNDEDIHIDILDKHSIILTAPASSNTFKNSNHGIAKLSQKFTFSHIYGPSTTQKELFDNATLGLVKDFISGQNCLLFTYGATNSGKTYTVQGTPTDQGILPRTLDVVFNTVGEHQYQKNDLKPQYFCSIMRLDERDIQREEERKDKIFKIGSELSSTFSQSTMSLSKLSTSDDSLNSSHQLTEISRMSQPFNEVSRASSGMESQYHDSTSLDLGDTESMKYAIFVSFAEIYNEYIYDLLEKMPTSKKNKRNPLVLGEDRNGSIYIKGLQEVRVRSAEEAWRLLEVGRQNLHFAATRLNHNSSRSHCIFTIKMIKLANADSPHVARVSMLSVCDLAGTERAGKTLSNQDRLKEAGNINTSLLVLSRCIEALRRNQIHRGSKKREIPVPYRDSRLTRLFQTFFLGRGKAAMIVNISKTPLLFDETLQVLKFSAIAKQIAISQVKEARCSIQPPKRISQFSKFVRQSLNSSGRLSVPWVKGAGDVTFGASDDIPEEHETDVVEEDDQDERYEALLQLIASLKNELVKIYKEKVELEDHLREELCAEFSQQLVEIESSWSQRLKDQQARSEELTEWRLTALLKSAKKINIHKRFRPDDDPDEEYVSSLTYFQEQHKVQEQSKYITELESEKKHLMDEVEALKNVQKKTTELNSKCQGENSKLTFQLAQLTQKFDQVTKELEETRRVSQASSGTESLVIQELQHRLDDKMALLEVKDNEIKELKDMLYEAAEAYIAKDQECDSLTKKLEMNEKITTNQMMSLNELENQLEAARAIVSQRAAQVDDRDLHIDELREQLSSQKLSSMMVKEHKECCKQLEKLEVKKQQLEEEYLRDKSRLLLEIAELKSNRAQTSSNSVDLPKDLRAAELKVMELQLEKEALSEERDRLGNGLAESKSLFSHLQQVNAQLEKDYGVLEREHNHLKDNINELNNKLISVQEERAAEQLNLSSLKANSESAMNERNTLLSQLLESDEKIRFLEMQVQELTLAENSCVQELEKNTIELKDKMVTLEAALRDAEVENAQYTSIKTRCHELSETLEKMQREKEETEKEKEHLQDKLNKMEEKHKILIEVNTTQMQKNIDSLENSISQMKKEFKQKITEIEAVTADKEITISSLKETIDNNNLLNNKLQSENESIQLQFSQEILSKNSEIKELVGKNEVLHEELDKIKSTLDRRIESEIKLHERIEMELKCKKLLEEECELIKLKSDEQNLELEILRTVCDAEKKFNSKSVMQISELEAQKVSMKTELDKLIGEHDALNIELEKTNGMLVEYKDKCSETEIMDKELSDHQKLLQELQVVKTTLETKLIEKEADIAELKDSKNYLKLQLKNLEEEKGKLEMKLMDQSNRDHREDELKDCVMTLNKENAEIKSKCVTFEELCSKLTSQLSEKEDLISSLYSKVESLDYRLAKADREMEELRHEDVKLEALREKCNISEKEIRAVREARQEEVSQCSRQLGEQEELLKQKEEEISSLQQEVKKLLQQSLVSIATTNQSMVSEASIAKRETLDQDIDATVLREQLRQSEAQNDSLLQEINELKNQRKMSLISENSIMQCSVTKASLVSTILDASTSDVDSRTPALGKRGRKPLKLAVTPSEFEHPIFDDSVGNESLPSTKTCSAANSGRMSSRPQRASRRLVTRTTRNECYEYEDKAEPKGLGDDDDDDDDDVWQPSIPMKRAPKSARKPKGNKSRSQVPNPHLKDQENKSSVANKADDTQLPQDSSERTGVQRRKRQLYKSAVCEPYQGSPNLAEPPTAVDSPHSIVRRQLRNKNK
nr:kinesin-like protein KIF20B isoform X3 [Procambarus clarkii]